MTTGPTDEKVTTAAGGPDGMPLALRFSEVLGVTAARLPNGRYRTAAGSEMRITGGHGGISHVFLDWLEERSACCDCVVDPYEHDGRLHWSCDVCSGGSALLFPVTPNV